MQCAEVLCIRANARQAWLPVNVKKEGNISCVPLNATKSPWAIRLLTSGTRKARDPSECALALKAFEIEVRHESPSGDQTPKKTQGCALSLDSDDEGQEEDESPSGPRSLDMESDDDERPAASGGASKKRKANIMYKSVKKVGLRLVALGSAGAHVTLGFGKGPGLLLQPDPQNILAAISYVDDNFDRLAAQGRSSNVENLRRQAPNWQADASISQQVSPVKHARIGQQPVSPKEKSTSIDAGRVRFDLKSGGYIIHYAAGDGKVHRLTAGFLVPRSDHMGHPLDSVKYAAAKKGVLEKARDKWNSLDQSAAPRYR